VAAYSEKAIVRALLDVLEQYKRDKKTGRIIITIDATQGAVGTVKITKETMIAKS